MVDITAKKQYYLRREHFVKMLCLAGALHVVAVVIWLMTPGLTVNKIPVRVLNIKLGTGVLTADASTGQAQQGMRATLSAQPRPVPPPAKHDRSTSDSAETPLKKEAPTSKKANEAAAQTKGAAQAGTAARQNSGAVAAGAAKGLPSQYVREFGDAAGSGAGSAIGNSSGDAAEITKRYGQLISLWIQKHKSYPPALKRQGVEGNALIRIRLNRTGQILHFRLEKSTGSKELDEAVLAMVKASNPLPAAPANYPSPNLIEFLIPVNYKLR